MSEQPYEGSWAVAHITCPICGCYWIAHYPAICVRLQCGECGYMVEAPSLPIRFDEDGHPIAEDRDLYDAIEGIDLLGQEEDTDGEGG